MQYIKIPTKDHSPVSCTEHRQPIPRGSFIDYEVTDTEYTFWNSLDNQNRTRLRDEAFKRCFYDALHEEMQKTRRLFHEDR